MVNPAFLRWEMARSNSDVGHGGHGGHGAMGMGVGPSYVAWGSDQANLLFSIEYHSKNGCFQALYRTFWPQNEPHRELRVLEVDMILQLQHFFAL